MTIACRFVYLTFAATFVLLTVIGSPTLVANARICSDTPSDAKPRARALRRFGGMKCGYTCAL